MSVYFLGDIHGDLKPISSWASNYAESGDTLIQVGDFGCGFIHIERIKSLARTLEQANAELLVIRGNHDDPSWFDNRKIGPITFLPSNCVREVEGKNMLFMGGAVSIDRLLREVNRDWWRGEEYIHDEEFLAAQRNINIVVTHTSPQLVNPCIKKSLSYYTSKDSTLQEDLNAEGNRLNKAYDILRQNNVIEKWYFGHFHVSCTHFVDGTSFNCLDINELKIYEG